VSDDSPLFVSAIELLSHSVELYVSGEERKYKLVILHLANAVELILKDRLIDLGESIYLRGKPITISIWESFDRLCQFDVAIKERPLIELLVDDRNTIQHRFGSPNAETVFYYLDRVVRFFDRFLDEQYSVDLAETLGLYLDRSRLEVIGLVPQEQDDYSSLDALFQISPESATIQAFNQLERKFMSLIPADDGFKGPYSAFWRSPDFPHLLDDLVVEGYFDKDITSDFNLVRNFRNLSAHAHREAETVDAQKWVQVIAAAKRLLRGLDQAIEDGLFAKRMARRRAEADADSDASSQTDEHAPTQ
jgi:hypothetical protein